MPDLARPLRVAIAGYGYMGEIRRKNVEQNPHLRLVGVADPLLEKEPRRLAGVPSFHSYRDLLDQDLDGLIVCTSNDVTAKAIIAALARGLHVFSEKPPARNMEEMRAILAAERKAKDRKLLFGFNHRYHPAMRDAHQLLRSGELGRLLWMRGVYGKAGGAGFETAWRNDAKRSGGGILLDQGIHMLDLFRFFAGDFPTVHGIASTLHWRIPVEDNAFLTLQNKAGVIAQLHSSATQWRNTLRLELGLERGYMTIQGLLSKSGSYGRETLVIGRRSPPGRSHAVGNPDEETRVYDRDDSWQIQIDQWADAIRGKKRLRECNSADAAAAMEIIEKVYQRASGAARSGGTRSISMVGGRR